MPAADRGGADPVLDPSGLPPPGAPLAVAVSGGSDSLALLHLLAERAPQGLVALTVDHGLRAEAAAEARFVAGIARGLGIPHRVLEWRGWDGRGNLPGRARAARYRLLAGWCAAHGVFDVALGHTRDDDIETLFLGLARGAGLDGLSGIRPRFVAAGVTFHRPLLAVSRAALRDGLRRRGVAWIDDPSNDDPGYDRVRIRRALAGLDLDPSRLAASLDNLRATRRDLGREVLVRLTGGVSLDHGDLLLDRGLLEAMTAEFRRRTLSAALRLVSGSPDAPRGADLMRLVAADWARPRTLHGCLLHPTSRSLRIAREYAAVRHLACAATAVWDRRWRVEGLPPPGLEIRALGPEGLAQCPPRERGGPPHQALIASPALWRDRRLVAAPAVAFRRPEAENLHLVAEYDLDRFRALILSH